MSNEYPTSKTQQMVLKALGLSSEGYAPTEKLFKEMGLIVASKRVGRSVEPVITLRPSQGGALNSEGEGEGWENDYKNVDLTKISQWISK